MECREIVTVGGTYLSGQKFCPPLLLRSLCFASDLSERPRADRYIQRPGTTDPEFPCSFLPEPNEVSLDQGLDRRQVIVVVMTWRHLDYHGV
jgi:hypothetical protein